MGGVVLEDDHKGAAGQQVSELPFVVDQDLTTSVEQFGLVPLRDALFMICALLLAPPSSCGARMAAASASPARSGAAALWADRRLESISTPCGSPASSTARGVCRRPVLESCQGFHSVCRAG